MSRLLVESTMLSGLKFASASDTTKLLHVLALCYAADNLTDGYISDDVARKLTKARPEQYAKAIAHLSSIQPGCTAASWERRGSAWFLHDYDDPLYGNPMKADLDTRRDQKAKAGAEGGKKSAEARREKYGTAQPAARSQHGGDTSQHEGSTEITQSDVKPARNQHKPALSTGGPDQQGTDTTPHERSTKATQARATTSSAPEADPEAALPKQPEAGASTHAAISPEAGPKLARAGAQAQPFPTLPLPTSPSSSSNAPPSPSVSTATLRDAIQNGHAEDLALQYAVRVAELLGRDLAPLEVGMCSVFLDDFAYLSVDDMLKRMHDHLEHCMAAKLPTPRKLHGFRETLRLENEHHADARAPKAWRPDPVLGDLSKLATLDQDPDQ